MLAMGIKMNRIAKINFEIALLRHGICMRQGEKAAAIAACIAHTVENKYSVEKKFIWK